MMISFLVVFAVNPILEAGGQIAAIVICLFTLILVVISLALHFALSFSFTWVREKAELIKLPRPKVENMNKTTEDALKGVEPPTTESPVVRAVADVPAQVHAVDKKVEQVSDRVADAIIEFRARTVQAQTIVKAFLAPRSLHREQPSQVDKEGLEFKSPGYRRLMEQHAPEVPVAPEGGDGRAQTVTAAQLKENAHSH
jgi:hypothetical protein